MFTLCPDQVGMHFARAAIPDSITCETLAAQAALLSDCAATLLPDGSLDVIAYACTSGSLVIGEQRVKHELNIGAPGAIATTLITGVIRALEHLCARRIVVATPYLDEINSREKTYLEQRGFEVLDIQGLNIEKDSEMVCITPEFIRDYALDLNRSDADALFVSCGALRTLDIVDELEQKAGKPVVCSNQAMAWDTFRLAGIDDRIAGYGSLFDS